MKLLVLKKRTLADYYEKGHYTPVWKVSHLSGNTTNQEKTNY